MNTRDKIRVIFVRIFFLMGKKFLKEKFSFYDYVKFT